MKAAVLDATELRQVVATPVRGSGEYPLKWAMISVMGETTRWSWIHLLADTQCVL